MMNDLLEYIRQHVQTIVASQMTTMPMIVSSYNPALHAVKGALQPSGVETGWIPLKVAHSGDGYGILAGPKAGDQMIVMFIGGDGNTPIAFGSTHNDVDKPPLVKSGELLIKAQSGASIAFTEDENSTWTGSANTTSVHNADGSITHTDAAGGIIHQKDKKIYLGDKDASLAVLLEGGVPSRRIFGVV